MITSNRPFALGVVICALLSLANRLQADPLDQWTVRDVLPLAANLRGVT